MNWFEDLPENCPPKDAIVPNGENFYRLAKNNPPKNEDFFSQRKEFPFTIFDSIPECLARAVSTWKTTDKCREQKKYPRHRNKVIAELTLYKKDGLIKQTFKNNHYSWWRSDDFSIESVKILDES
ncbi:MAG: hypothetical protein IPN76_15875 [Saprospiraceae bacterium]|nr:hypothetical protein [Saprospiraceae bacterium]